MYTTTFLPGRALDLWSQLLVAHVYVVPSKFLPCMQMCHRNIISTPDYEIDYVIGTACV